MKKIISITIVAFLFLLANAQGYKVGDEAKGFSLKNVNGETFNTSELNNIKGLVVIFTCNHCPYVKAYEDRIIEIDKTYKPQGFPVIAINSNDAGIVPEDSYENMIKRAKDKGFTFPYLHDPNQTVANLYGATRTPHVFVLFNEKGKLIVKYIGAIDNNYQDAAAVTEKYLTNALDALLAGSEPKVSFTKAVGCTIKKKK